MYQLQKKTKDLLEQINAALERLHIEDKLQQVTELETELLAPEIWNNPAYAQDKSRQLAAVQAETEPWITLQTQTADLVELMDLGDDSLQPEFETQLSALEKEYDQRRRELLFDGE